MTKQTKKESIKLMRDGLSSLIYCSQDLNIKELKNKHTHAGLLLQRGLLQWKNDEQEEQQSEKQNKDKKEPKTPKSKLIDAVSELTYCSLYTKAYDRWLKYTADETRFAFTAAKIVGRLYTGLSSATALETGITTHHTYGMPMIMGSSVKGAVRTFAEQIGIKSEICAVLFGDDEDGENKASGAIVWHDAWWIPSSGKPFAEEIITTHHQNYYNGSQKEADEMESPIPNQQIATQGSFYFVIESNIAGVKTNQAWLKFANNLLFEMLQQQGLGSKTASGYGYFEIDAALIEQIIDKHRKIKKQQEEDKIAAMSRYRQIIHKWQTHLESKEKYSVNNQAHSDFYKELVKDLQEVAQSTEMTKEEKAQIAEVLSIKKIQTKHPNWITKNRKNEISPILDILRSNTP